MAALVGGLGLNQRGNLQLLSQLDTGGHAAGGLGLLIKHRFVLCAVVHAGGQIVLFQHHRHLAREVQRNHIAGGTHGTLGFILDQRAFTELRHFDAFLLGQYHRHDAFADETALSVAQRQLSQYFVHLAQVA